MKTDMGRMFGFAYGEKENGAVFSHMAVMFANALYQRGFAKEGYKALNSLYRQSMNTERSRIYPGVPEYFGAGGRGLYHYLTGAASWYMLTVVTQMFGVRGTDGHFVAEPKLLASQFTHMGNRCDTSSVNAPSLSVCPVCGIDLTLMNKKWHIEYQNPDRADYGEYEIGDVSLDGCRIFGTDITISGGMLKLSKNIVDGLEETEVHHLIITLLKKK